MIIFYKFSDRAGFPTCCSQGNCLLTHIGRLFGRQSPLSGRDGCEHAERNGDDNGSICPLLRDARGGAGQTLQRHQFGVQPHQAGEPH